MKQLGPVLRQRYPSATPKPFGTDYLMQDDGGGPYTAAWNDQELGRKPTDEQLLQWGAGDDAPDVERFTPAQIIAAVKAIDPAKSSRDDKCR